MSYYHLGPITGNKKRMLGLTAEKPFADNLLIMHKLQSNTLDDVSHNPVSSSDELLSELSDGAFDESEPSSKHTGIPEKVSALTSERERHILAGSPRPELDVDKSNIPSTSFFSRGRSSETFGGQSFKRSFQAMHDGAMDEDERTEQWGSKKPKMRKYGQGRGIDSMRGSQAVIKEQPTKNTNGAGRRKPRAQGNGGLFLQHESSGNNGRTKLIYDPFELSRRRIKHR